MKAIVSNDQIFLQEESHPYGSDQEIQYQKSSGQNQNEYLSQFLNYQGAQILQQKMIQKSEQDNNIGNEIADNIPSFTMLNKQGLAKNKKREKSCFHNFQKHLVITLRNVIKLKKCLKQGQIQSIAYEMWNVFSKSTLYSKKFLHVLFGVFGNNQDNQFSKNFLNELGFMEIFAKYSQGSIKQSQTYLRKEIIKQLEGLNLREYLTYRKLKRVDQFKTYIEQFLGQLKEGSVRKRLPKDKKMKMITLIKDNLTSPQMQDQS